MCVIFCANVILQEILHLQEYFSFYSKEKRNIIAPKLKTVAAPAPARPRHARRPSPSLITLDTSPAPRPRFGQRSGRSRPKSPDLLKAHAQHPARNAETA